MLNLLFASVVHCYVGCGGGSPDRQALHVLACDTETGAAKIVQSVKGVQGTNYGAIDANGRYLYSYVSEERGDAKATAVVRFPLQTNGRLGACARVTGLPCRTPCHVALSPDGRFCSFAVYGQGVSGVIPLADFEKNRTQGMTPPVSVDTLPDDAMGPDRARQEKAHAHCTFYTPDAKLMGVIDLGCDRIVFFRPEAMQRPPVLTLTSDPGDGPRHAIWSKDNRFLFVINELGNSVTSFAFDGKSFSRVGKWTTLPPGRDMKSLAPFSGGMTAPKASAIKLTADGKLLMASNRGYDSIAFFDVDTSAGTLKHRRDAKLGGSFPRDFELMPGERFMVVGYELSNKIEICRFDRAACTLEPVGEPIAAWQPIYFTFNERETVR